MKNFQKFLKSCSKNEASYKKLVKFVEEIVTEREEAKTRLGLLESAIRSDYDSILITTLGLEKPGPKIVYVNDGFTRMTGYSREEVIGRTPRILQGPKTDRKVLNTLKKRLKEGQSFFGHTVNYRKDGSEFINQWDIHPLTNKEGEITHWVSYQHDITERKRSEKKVVDSRLEFDSLMEESKKTVVDLDQQGNIISANKAFRDLLGYDDEELKKKKLPDLFAPEHREQYGSVFETLNPDEIDENEYELILLNSKETPIEVKVNTRVMNMDGRKVLRATIENKTLQKKVMKMLKKRNANYEKMFDNMRDFRYKLYRDDSGTFRFRYVSDPFKHITGIMPEKAEDLPVKDLVHVDDYEKVLNHLHIVIQGKPNTEQFRIKSKNGYVGVIDYAKPVWDSGHKTVSEIKGAISTEISSVSGVKKT